MMDRREFLKAAAIAGLALNPMVARAMEVAKKDTRPNFVFILIDDQRYDLAHCTGNPVAKTPNIDRIARDGVIFENAFVTLSLCSPSRAAFLTGQYGHCNGVFVNETRPELDPAIPTWPKLLQEAGYDTAFIGKWHQGKGNYPRKGFNHWVSFDGQGVYENPTINTDGKVSQINGYMTDILSDAAMDWLKKDRTEPFCLYLPHKAIHGPFTPAARHETLYTDAKFPHPPNCYDNFEGKPAWLKEGRKPKNPNAPNAGAGLDEPIRKQLRCLAAADEGIGRILDYLAQSGKLENTVIAFAGDNGFYHGEHGLGDKRTAYEESVRIPLIVSYPKMIKPGSKIGDTVLNIDFAPTMLELAGVKAPGVMQGKSMVPLLKGKNEGWRTEFLYEYMSEPQFPKIPSVLAVRTNRWKYIRYPEIDDIEELYDLSNDRYELKNLASDPKYASTLAEMKKKMDVLLTETKGKEFWKKRVAPRTL
jgi:arylsulfatase A-like enzyme